MTTTDTTSGVCTCTTEGFCEPCRQDAILFAKSKPILPRVRRKSELEPLPIPRERQS